METNSSFYGTEKINKIFFKIAPPVMLAQLIQALYNIVEQFIRREILRERSDGVIDHLSCSASDDRTGSWNRCWNQYKYCTFSGNKEV